MLALTDPRKALVSEIAPHLHEGQHVEAARAIAAFSGIAPKIENKSEALELVWSLVHWLFDENHYFEVAELLWPRTLFDSRPESTKQIWDVFDSSSLFLVQGSASVSKSYSLGVRLMLEWIRDPDYTNVKVLGPSQNHLEANLFSHLVSLHRQSSLPIPGAVGQLFIGLDPRNRKSAISGVVIPLGRKAAGRLQGTKRIPRPSPHPQFGALSRLFVFLDEAEMIPVGIWRDCENILSNSGDVRGFKLFGAYNPQDNTSQVAQRAEPADGWGSFDIDTSLRWKSRRGWDVLRLDAFKQENVISGRVIYPGLQTKEGLDAIIAGSGGYNTPGYYSMARGAYPPSGTSYSVINETMLHKVRGTLVFLDKPRRCAGVDIALEGGDTAEMAVGRFGLASGVTYPPTLAFPDGVFVPFKDATGKVQPKQAIQVDQFFVLPPADTVRMAEEIRRALQSLGVEPEWVMLDRTGNGAGVHDVLRELWSPMIRGVNYSEAASKRKVAVEDSDTAEVLYERAVSELWFAMRKFLEFEYVKIAPGIEFAELKAQLTGRLFHPGKRHKVESKRDYKSRGNRSPDKADALSLIIHAVRLASGVVIGALSANAPGDESDDAPVFQVIGCTDRCRDDL